MNPIPHDQQCPHCGRYDNRGVSVDAVIVRDGQVLLIKRGIEPQIGKWATPGGYVEWNESTEDAIRREVKEETGLTVTSLTFLALRSNPDRSPRQVINIPYLAEVEPGEAHAGDDAADLQWFGLNHVPDDLAFDHNLNIQDARSYLNRHPEEP